MLLLRIYKDVVMCLRIKATLLLVSLFSAWSLKSEVLYDNAAIALIDSNGHAEIPENYTSIDIRAFDGAQTLRSVTIPDSITKIGEYAFSNTPYLTSIVIPSSVTAIYDGTFSGSGT